MHEKFGNLQFYLTSVLTLQKMSHVMLLNW